MWKKSYQKKEKFSWIKNANDNKTQHLPSPIDILRYEKPYQTPSSKEITSYMCRSSPKFLHKIMKQ